MTAPLLTASIRKQLIANFRENQRGESEIDHVPVVKLFTPDAQATWLLSEYDPALDLCFGLCDLGLGCPELGYVSLAELTALRGPLGLPIKPDRSFQADMPISSFASEARKIGRIAA